MTNNQLVLVYKQLSKLFANKKINPKLGINIGFNPINVTPKKYGILIKCPFLNSSHS